MIKVITAIVCAFAAMLMIILSVATTYWLQWVIVSDGHNITHYRGLFKHCFESRDNVTNELIKEDSGCTGEYTDFKAGTDFVKKTCTCLQSLKISVGNLAMWLTLHLSLCPIN